MHGRRTSAAHFLKFQAGVDTELSERHFQGPARSRNLRRHAILDVSRSQRATEVPVMIKPVAAGVRSHDITFYQRVGKQKLRSNLRFPL